MMGRRIANLRQARKEPLISFVTRAQPDHKPTFLTCEPKMQPHFTRLNVESVFGELRNDVSFVILDQKRKI